MRVTDWSAHLPDGIQFDESDLLSAESLPRAWGRWFREAPERLALIAPETNQTLTYRQLDNQSRAFATHFSNMGLSAGDRVLFSSATSIQVIIAYVAAQRLGLVVVPASNALTRSELEFIIDDVRPTGAFVDEPERAAWMNNSLLVFGPQSHTSVDRSLELDNSASKSLALIAYTSGTTGTPKGAMLSTGNLLASAESLRIAWRWTSADKLVLALPLFHVHGLGVGLNGTLISGACAIVLSKFDVDTVLDAVSSYDATLFFGVPTMYVRLVASHRAAELGRLRLAVSGSAPLAADLHIKFAAITGNSIIERYGMTETVITVSNPYEGERRPGSVGLPLLGVRIQLNEAGELLVRGPSVFQGYWNQPEATADSFTKDGWFRTGDLGDFDSDGYLRIVGRSKDLIISGGFNVYPREVEDVLRRHPSVDDVAVTGSPSNEWGEIVVAWIVPLDNFDAEELLTFATRHLATYKRPRVVKIVDQLPRNHLGKVLKHALPPV